MFRTRVRLAVLPIAAICGLLLFSRPAAAAPQCAGPDCIYFAESDSVSAALVNAINAETVRIDMSTWYLDDSNVYTALLNKFKAGVPVRLIGDRGSIFEADANTRATFEYLASEGVPIRLRYNPTWYPEIDHWKASMFVGQGLVEFGSPNYTVFELAPFSSTNYNDENALFTTDPTLFNAMESKFDTYWNDTTTEPESLISGPPYFKNWDDACALETACSDYKTNYPNPKPMVINTARLFPDYAPPADLIFGQGNDFNSRLITEINNENTAFDLTVYRLTVPDMANAILARFQAGVGVRILLDPREYQNRVYPEFWLTHAYIDMLWAAGVPIMQRAHTGNMHMKTLITSNYATIGSSNFMAAWQRDHDYFLPRATKPVIWQAIEDNFNWMWSNVNGGYAPFTPTPPDPAPLESPAAGATGVTTTPTLTWDRAALATDYDVYLWPSGSSVTRVANVPALLTSSPPTTYSWTATSALQCSTTYFWQIVARTFATPKNPSLTANNGVQQFTTGNTGCGGGGGGGGAVPSPWTNQDVGSTGQAGSATYASGVFTVNGSGADIWGSADAFQFVSQPASGDATIIARVSSEQNTSTYAKAGVMFRQSLTSSSAHVMLDVTPNGGIEFMTRTSGGAQTTFIAGSSQAFPVWLKLARSGSTITGSISSNGTTWTTVGSTSTSMTAATNVGLIVTSHDTSRINTSTFDNVSVTADGGGGGGGGGGAVPAPWVSQDVGSTGTAGSSTFASGVFTVNGSGADIWGSTDAFQYVYQPVSGDQTIVARVVNEQNTSQYAKAGVMIRQSTSPSDAHVILDVTPNGGVEFMTRTAAGAQTTFIAGSSQAFPAWLKLARTGSTVTASVSANGTTWTTVGSTTTAMSSSFDIGILVTSHDTSRTNTGTFDNVAVTASGPPPPPPPPSPNVVVYAGDVTAANIHGSWHLASDGSAAGGSKLASSDAGVSNTASALASPTDYVDVTFNANAGTPYTLWMRVEAANNSKFNDSFYVQFSDASANGSSVYRIGTTSSLVVNLAPDSTGSTLNNWGWVNGAYWLSQPATFTFPTTGAHTLRVQVREDGVAFDQIVLSPTQYFNAGATCPTSCGSAPGPLANDATIVPKP